MWWWWWWWFKMGLKGELEGRRTNLVEYSPGSGRPSIVHRDSTSRADNPTSSMPRRLFRYASTECPEKVSSDRTQLAQHHAVLLEYDKVEKLSTKKTWKLRLPTGNILSAMLY